MGNITWGKFYKKTVFSNGMVTLEPFEEVKNTFIMLHDYSLTAEVFS